MKIDSIQPVVPVDVGCDGIVPLIIRFDNYDGPNVALGWVLNYVMIRDSEDSLIEVGVDPDSGAICEVTVVSVPGLLNEPISPIGTLERIAEGLPRAVLATWSNEQMYVDEEHEVTASLVGNRLTLAFDGFDQSMPNSVRCDRVIFLIDESNTLRGIELRDLSEGEIENFRHAAK